MAEQSKWTSIPDEAREAWQRIFGESEEPLFVSASCPICHHRTLRRYYRLWTKDPKTIRGKAYVGRGDCWEWCRHCHTWEHYSAAIPPWWDSGLDVDDSQLTVYPDPIEATIERRED